MRALLRISAGIDAFTERLGRLTGWIIPLMILIGAWNALGGALARTVRMGFNLTSNTLIEAQWYSFDLVFLLGAAYALKHNEHVRVDVFYANFSPKRKALINFLGSFLFLIPFSVIMIVVSWPWVQASWAILERSPDAGGLPRYPIKTMVIVCFVLLIIQGISEAIKNLAIMTGYVSPEVTEEGPSASDTAV